MIRRSTWVTLGIFALVLVAAIIIRRTEQKVAADATPTPGSTYLFNAQDSSIIGLRITDSDENSVAVQRAEDGTWSLIQPQGEQADQDRIDSVIGQAESLRVVSSLDTQPDLTAIGLDPPQYRLSITLADGQQQVAEVGGTTPTGSGYYARLEGGNLQVVGQSGLDSVVGLLADPPIAPPPTPETSSTETPQP
jgi:hypothetical protein